jgi:hypothetical protein
MLDIEQPAGSGYRLGPAFGGCVAHRLKLTKLTVSFHRLPSDYLELPGVASRARSEPGHRCCVILGWLRFSPRH